MVNNQLIIPKDERPLRGVCRKVDREVVLEAYQLSFGKLIRVSNALFFAENFSDGKREEDLLTLWNVDRDT